MIQYNPKDWLTFVFKFHKADTFRKLLPLILLIAVYSGFIAYLETDVLELKDTSRIKNLSLIHTTLGLVISMLLVFRTNTAYERWWEGRKLWGSLVNSSRNLAIKLKLLLPDNPAESAFFRAAIPNYAFALKNHLRGKYIDDEIDLIPGTEPFQYDSQLHVPNLIAEQILGKCFQLRKHELIGQEHLIILNNELQNFTDVCGGCERIRKTPIPFSYSVFLKKFIFLYVMTLPFAYVFSLGYLVIPVIAIIFYVLASLELIAEEIEDPFGTDANDLPTDEIAAAIRKSVQQVFDNKKGL